MKSSKKIMLVVLSLAGVLTGCGNHGENTSGNNSTDTPVKIGLIMYSWDDTQGKTIKNYCDYLSTKLPLTFAYEATYYQDDRQLECVENLITAGCNAIISGYDTNIASAVDTAAASNVYYSVCLDGISESDFGENVTISPYFVGGTQQFGGDLAKLGQDFANAAIEKGVSHVGGVSFPAWAFNEATPIYTSFKSTLEAAGKTCENLEYSAGFTQTDVATAARKVLTDHPGVDSVFGMSSGLDYVYPEIKDDNVTLISMGYDTSVKSLMEAGKLLIASTNNYVQSIASCVARIVNAIDGKSYADSASGAYNKGSVVNGVASYPLMTSTSEVDDFNTYIAPETSGMDNSSVNADDLKNVILRYNANATLSDLNALTNRSMAEVKAARTSGK